MRLPSGFSCRNPGSGSGAGFVLSFWEAAAAHPLQEGPVRRPRRPQHQDRRRKLTKREAIASQMVDKSSSADLRATKMLIDR